MKYFGYCSVCGKVHDFSTSACPIDTAFSGGTPRPYCCPVCNGHKTVSRPPWVAGDVESWTDSGTKAYECRACNGTGVIWR